jgi:hypothetical protein
MADIDSVYDDNDTENVEEEESEVEEEESEVDKTEEESEDETFIERVSGEVIEAHETALADYVEDPQTPKELTKNESIKKFLVKKVCDKLLKSFESHRVWAEDVELLAIVKRWKRLMAEDDQLDSIAAMGRILKETSVITEVVEEQVDEVMETDDVETEDNEGEVDAN